MDAKEARGRSAVVGPPKPRLLGMLGPGLISGVSDDDPYPSGESRLPISQTSAYKGACTDVVKCGAANTGVSASLSDAGARRCGACW